MIFFCHMVSHAQVGINTIDPKASLDIPASDVDDPLNTDGLLVPRVSTFPTTAPTLNQDSMIVYLTQDITGYLKGFYYWDNSLMSPDWIPFDRTEWKKGVNATGDDLIFAQRAKLAGTDVVITNDGRIGFGTEDPVERFELKGPGDNDFQITSANTNPPNLIFYNTGGTLDMPDVLATDGEIGSVIVKTHDGVTVQEPGGIRFFMDGQASPGSTPSKFVVETTPDGSTTDVQRLIIRSNGNTGLTEENPTATLHIRAGSTDAASAPLKFSQGSLLTTIEKGAIEYNGNDLYFTPNTSRQVLMRGYKAKGILDFPLIARGNQQSLTLLVQGATVGSVCSCSPRVAIENNLHWNCYVSSINTVTIILTNNTNGGGAGIDPASAEWSITVIE